MSNEKFTSFDSLALDINKANDNKSEFNETGIDFPLEQEMSLNISDKELLSLSRTWEEKWNKSKFKWDTEGRDYYLGNSFHAKNDLSDRPMTSNMIFESVETSLPQFTAQNPEPIVTAIDSKESQDLANILKEILIKKADTQKLKIKVRKGARHWFLYKLGIWQVEWNRKKNDYNFISVNPKTIMLDPDGEWDGNTFDGEWVCRVRKSSLRYLKDKFGADAVREIVLEAEGNMSTTIRYKEWWTDEYVFWTYKNIILDKNKNPHFNYKKQEELTNLESGETSLEEVDGQNHFKHPKKPFIGMTVFNLGESPTDDTGLVEQNLSTQDILNKRITQIDKNIDSMNGGILISGSSFNKDQSTQVSDTLRRPDGVIFVPQGDVNTAINKITTPSLPADVYNDVLQRKQDLRSNFGTTGFTPAGIKNEETVGGKIMVRGQDQNRTLPISEAVEQVYDEMFNWSVQMMYVYYKEDDYIPLIGAEKYQKIGGINTDAFITRFFVSVKEGSLIPKDPLTKRNEAMDLWSGGALSLITLHERLEDPDPMETAKQALLWQTDPMSLFPDLQKPIQEMPVNQEPAVINEQEVVNNMGLPNDLSQGLNNLPI